MGVRELGNPLGNPLGLARKLKSFGLRSASLNFYGTSVLFSRDMIPFQNFMIAGIRQNNYQGSSYNYIGFADWLADGGFQIHANNPAPILGAVDLMELPTDAKLTTINTTISTSSGGGDRTYDIPLDIPVDTKKTVVSAFFKASNVSTTYLYPNLFAYLLNSKTVRVKHGANAGTVTTTFNIVVQIAELREEL